MEQAEMLLRLGQYCGAAANLLHDKSYGLRFLGRLETLTEEEYLGTVREISERLIAAGLLNADDDLYETTYGHE